MATKRQRSLFPKKWRYRIVVIFLLFATLVLGGSNLWLKTRWATSLLEDALEKQTGLPWSVGSMGWSPWNGFSIYHLSAYPPAEVSKTEGDVHAPLFELGQVRVSWYWLPLAKREVHLREISVKSPRLMVSPQMILAVAGREINQKLDVKKAQLHERGVAKRDELVDSIVARAKGEKKPKFVKNEKINPIDQGESTNVSPTRIKSEGEQPVVHQKEVVSPPPSQSPHQYPLRLHVTGGELSLAQHLGGEKWLQVSGIDVDVQLFAGDSQGALHVGEVMVAGQALSKNLVHPLNWHHSYLEWNEEDIDFFGVKLKGNVKVQVPEGDDRELWSNRFNQALMTVNFQLPKQKFNSVHGLDWIALGVSGDEISAYFECKGLLKYPSTWRSEAVAVGKNIKIKEHHGGGEVVFDEVVFPVIFQNSVLSWSGVRLIGEDASVLGNGHVSYRDGWLGVTRLVVSPEISAELSRALLGAGITHQGPSWWHDLDTSDRKVRDIIVKGPILQPVANFGNAGEELPVWEVFKSIIHFIRVEMKEEGVELPRFIPPNQ